MGKDLDRVSDADLLRPWQAVGDPPPAGYIGPPCRVCGQSVYLELGGGDATDVNRPNLDCRPLPNVDIVCDLAKESLPFHDEHAEAIRMIHVLNHLSAVEGMHLLRECYRVLQPRGSLYIMVPDLTFICQRILEDGPRDCWMTCLHGTRGDTHDADWHKWNYTLDSLRDLLYEVGFTHAEYIRYANAWEFQMEAFK